MRLATNSKGNDCCPTHRRYDGFGDKPRTGCAACWYLWLRKLRFSHPTDADAKYIAKMQSERALGGRA